MNKNSSRLGELLITNNEITLDQLDDALDEQVSSNEKLGSILIKKGYVSEVNVLKSLYNQTGIPLINLDNMTVNKDAARIISEKLARRTNSIPVGFSGDKLLVAMIDPLNIFDVEDIELEAGMKVEASFATKSQITESIDKFMSSRNTELAAREITSDLSVEIESSVDKSEDKYINNSPVVKLVNSLIEQALKMEASDIHIEPLMDKVRVRFRIDGDLHEALEIPIKSHSAIVTRIKVMAGMNISEKRLPQDGRLEMNVGSAAIDMRISVLPTVYGEKIVLRILNRGNFLKSKFELGFTHKNLVKFDSIMECPNGIILVAGPTGSGKTTTLYAYLNELNKINKNIITVEDPVEYKIYGINQIQANSKIGLSFASGLRSILRQDPDIIMIGEIRDEETAGIAVRAAITGHLVISTIHTNDAPSAIIRLEDMGIKTFLVAASLRGVISQRLVKKICTNCKEEYLSSSFENNLLEIKDSVVICKGAGCSKCYNTGYSGRIGIHEVMKVNQNMRNIIYNGGSTDELMDEAIKNGMTTLKDNCRQLVLEGITSVEEYSQVVYKL
ncbi:MAG: GspE/PulE family protein [Sedimentibacter saalensis]|uniref:GspE/PulE family protein n=1 Tax=Sedimentibacter saalensis TaxID=130788 RepID=UPI002B219D85|nr:GspE/PulE family protein [Sedimentibacter saalensis]MEA5095465.1 GspE/PulE family protein [Sedimentibacter saalensis]